jgi:hypothetical protein
MTSGPAVPSEAVCRKLCKSIRTVHVTPLAIALGGVHRHVHLQRDPAHTRVLTVLQAC